MKTLLLLIADFGLLFFLYNVIFVWDLPVDSKQILSLSTFMVMLIIVFELAVDAVRAVDEMRRK